MPYEVLLLSELSLVTVVMNAFVTNPANGETSGNQRIEDLL